MSSGGRAAPRSGDLGDRPDVGLATTGVPACCASRIGKPKPSSSDGYASAAACAAARLEGGVDRVDADAPARRRPRRAGRRARRAARLVAVRPATTRSTSGASAASSSNAATRAGGSSAARSCRAPARTAPASRSAVAGGRCRVAGARRARRWRRGAPCGPGRCRAARTPAGGRLGAASGRPRRRRPPAGAPPALADVGPGELRVLEEPAVVDRHDPRAPCRRDDVVGPVHDVGATQPAVHRQRGRRAHSRWASAAGIGRRRCGGVSFARALVT